MTRLVLANARNGLAWPHDDVCYFQSQYAHHWALGYFRLDSMPLRAVIHLLCGDTLEIVDGARRPHMPDALRYGVPTWCRVFNRAIRQPIMPVCPWETPEMVTAARHGRHKPVVATIRKLAGIYEPMRPAVIGENVLLTWHRCQHDDNVRGLRQAILTAGGLRQ